MFRFATFCFVFSALLSVAFAQGGKQPRPQDAKPVQGELRMKTNPALNVNSERIIRGSTAAPGEWLTYYGGYHGQRYSPLDQIDSNTVPRLKVAWSKELPGSSYAFEATPLVVDGVMYVTTGGDTSIFALDARTGKEYWHFTWNVPKDLSICCGWVNRGAALGDGKVFFVSLDAKLWALDAQTGKIAWVRQYGEPYEGETATLAPLVVKDKVLVGVSGGEYGIRGYIDAFDVRTGERKWRFYTVPGPNEPGHETWGGAPTWITGGGPTWITGTYDAELDTLYWGIGNPSPDFNGDVRPGDNLFTSSVVALDPDSGRLRWYFQFTPHDVWDYDSIQAPILADVYHNGRNVKALLHADKNGYFYMLDRVTGKFIYAQPFARITWAKGVDPQTGKPIINPEGLPTAYMKPICPGMNGATEWNQSSFSPQTGMVYIPVIEQCGRYRLSQPFYVRSLPFWGGYQTLPAFGPGENYGYLMAREASTGKEAWKIRTAHPVVASVLTTGGGLVFWAEANGVFNATDAKTGKTIWSDKTELGIRGSPMTYTVGGKQYVALATGWGGPVVPLLNAGKGHKLVVWSLP